MQEPRLFMKLLTVLALLGVAGAHQTAFAIVDVHDEYYTAPEQPTFFSFGASFDDESGDKEETNISASAHLILRRQNWTLLTVTEFDRGETNSRDTDDASFGHVRLVHQFGGSRHGAEAFIQYSDDRFADLSSRQIAGIGYRFEWIPGTAAQRGLLGAGIMRETEEFESLVREDKATRANFYGTYAAPITPQENVIFSFTGYYQPNIDETSDFRAVALSGLTFSITERFSIDLAAEYSSTRGLLWEGKDAIQSTQPDLVIA